MAGNLEQLSDVEDPRSALKDSRRVWRELGPHQMFLRQGKKRETGMKAVFKVIPEMKTRERSSRGAHPGPTKREETGWAVPSESIRSAVRLLAGWTVLLFPA